MTLTFDLLILKAVSESRVTWATFVPILVFLGLSVLDLGPMYVIDRQTDVRQHHRLMPLPIGGIINVFGRYFNIFPDTVARSGDYIDDMQIVHLLSA